ncbi:MAG TPA: ABC transporter permease, partial [Acidobacteriaceae bacterium]
IVFAALGTNIGSVIKDMQGFQVIMNFLVMPIFFLSGALYPLAHLPKALTIITHIDPLTYGVDGLRGMLIGAWHFSFALDVAFLVALAGIFLASGAYLFSRIQL